jgi:hypothetical protein
MSFGLTFRIAILRTKSMRDDRTTQTKSHRRVARRWRQHEGASLGWRDVVQLLAGRHFHVLLRRARRGRRRRQSCGAKIKVV